MDGSCSLTALPLVLRKMRKIKMRYRVSLRVAIWWLQFLATETFSVVWSYIHYIFYIRNDDNSKWSIIPCPAPYPLPHKHLKHVKDVGAFQICFAISWVLSYPTKLAKRPPEHCSVWLSQEFLKIYPCLNPDSRQLSHLRENKRQGTRVTREMPGWHIHHCVIFPKEVG